LRLGRAFALFGLALPAFAQYAGPAILSRGEAPTALVPPEIKFRPFLEIGGVYESGLAGVSASDSQQVPNLHSYGVMVTFGVSGTHSWRHTKLGLAYSGNVSHYSQQGSFDSISQSLMLGIQHQIARHISLSLRETGGVFTRGFGQVSLQQTVPFDPLKSYIPNTDFFDNRTYYLSSQADVMFQKTARLSFDFGGDSFLTRYRSSALHGTNGLGARGDIQYRVSRRTTIGGAYNFQHFNYTGLFGAADAHGLAFTFARALTAKTEFSAALGAYRVEQTAITDVPVDPVIAALFGVTTTTQIAHFVSWSPNLTGRLTQTFREGVAYVTGGRTVTPGNGLFLTSYVTSVTGGYTYTGLRRWSFDAHISYYRAKSLGNIIGLYDTATGGFALSRVLLRYVHLVLGYDIRSYSSPGFANYNRTSQQARVAIGFAPGDVPLRLW
jgi:hypothetical protein